MNVEIKTTGIKALEAKITVLQNRLDTNNPTGNLRGAMQRSLYRLQIDLAKYPARTSKWYVRTGTLGRRWTTRIDPGNPLVGRVGNNTKYAPEVQSATYQRYNAYKMGWKTDWQVLEANRAIILREFRDAVGSAVTLSFGVTVERGE